MFSSSSSGASLRLGLALIAVVACLLALCGVARADLQVAAPQAQPTLQVAAPQPQPDLQVQAQPDSQPAAATPDPQPAAADPQPAATPDPQPAAADPQPAATPDPQPAAADPQPAATPDPQPQADPAPAADPTPAEQSDLKVAEPARQPELHVQDAAPQPEVHVAEQPDPAASDVGADALQPTADPQPAQADPQPTTDPQPQTAPDPQATASPQPSADPESAPESATVVTAAPDAPQSGLEVVKPEQQPELHVQDAAPQPEVHVAEQPDPAASDVGADALQPTADPQPAQADPQPTTDPQPQTAPDPQATASSGQDAGELQVTPATSHSDLHVEPVESNPALDTQSGSSGQPLTVTDPQATSEIQQASPTQQPTLTVEPTATSTAGVTVQPSRPVPAITVQPPTGRPVTGTELQPADEPVQTQPEDVAQALQGEAPSSIVQSGSSPVDAGVPAGGGAVPAEGQSLAQVAEQGLVRGLNLGNEGTGAAADGAEQAASQAGRAMHDPDPAIRSAASAELNAAKRTGPVLKVVKPAIPFVGFGLDYASNALEGDSPAENLAKSSGSAIGGAAGTAAAVTLGGGCEVATVGLGTPACVVLAAAGAGAGGAIGEALGGWLYDHLSDDP